MLNNLALINTMKVDTTYEILSENVSLNSDCREVIVLV